MGASSVARFTQEDIRTLDDRRKKLIVMQGNQSYMYSSFRKNANVVQCYDNVELPIYLGSGTDGKWLGRGDNLPEGGDRKLASSVWNNRYLVVPTSEDIVDGWENDGNINALFNLRELSDWEAKLAWYRAMTYAIFHGTGGKQPDGLHSFLEKSAPSAQTGTFGGISKSTYGTWWYNQYVQLTGNFGTIAPGTTQTLGELAFSQLIDQCTVGTKIPSDVIMTKAIWKNFKRLYRERYNQSRMVARANNMDNGVGSFMIEGVSINWDPNIKADTIFALHLKDNFDSTKIGNEMEGKIFQDLEEVSVKNPLELSANMFAIINPNVRSISIEARQPYRQLSSTSWIADSFNMGVGRLSDNGVAGSDNGSRWSTW